MEDTIASISTSIGIGAISIVRISGNEAIRIVNEICSKDLTNVESHTINYAHIVDKEEVIDQRIYAHGKNERAFSLLKHHTV